MQSYDFDLSSEDKLLYMYFGGNENETNKQIYGLQMEMKTSNMYIDVIIVCRYLNQQYI